METSTSDDSEAYLRLFQEFGGAWHVSVETAIDRIDDDDAYSVVAHVSHQFQPFVLERFGRCSSMEREACDDLVREAAKVVQEWVHPLRMEDAVFIDDSIRTIAARYEERLSVSATLHCLIDIV